MLGSARDRGPVNGHASSSSISVSRFTARAQSIRTAPTERPISRGDRLERDVLQGTPDEGLAVVVRQAIQGIGQEHRLLAPARLLAGGADRRGQGLLNREAGAIEKVFQRLLALVVAHLAAVVLDLVGQAPHQDPPQPGNQLGLASPCELGELAVGLQERFLNQVRRLELDPQSAADQRAGHQPQVVAVKLKKFSPCRRAALAGLIQQPFGSGIIPHNRSPPAASRLRRISDNEVLVGAAKGV